MHGARRSCVPQRRIFREFDASSGFIYFVFSSALKSMTKIGIVGGGVVGLATRQFETGDNIVSVYDSDSKKCIPPNTSLYDVSSSDLIFVCVPTPENVDGSTDLKVVETVVSKLRCLTPGTPIVIRSTVPVGTCAKLGVYHLPEFLTEKNWKTDFAATRRWVFGSPSAGGSEGRRLFSLILNSAFEQGVVKSNRIDFVTNDEAEMVKYFRNSMLTVKLSFANELAQFCSLKNLDYLRVQEIATSDPRIGASHTKVPGPDGIRGFGGKCFPKDAKSLLFQMLGSGMGAPIIRAVLDRNREVDRLK